MLTKSTHSLKDVADGLLKPLSKTELKLVLSDLQKIGKTKPAVGADAEDRGRASRFHHRCLDAVALSARCRQYRSRILCAAITEPLEPQIETLIAEARDAWLPSDGGTSPSETDVMSRLRIIKRKVAFLVALADLARIFDGRVTTLWLSRLAEASVSAAIDHLLLSSHESRKLQLKNVARPSEGSGLVVLGMGKLGASELNYSSDIDIVVFFDEQAGILPIRTMRSRSFRG
jgi:glutamate-ammonia-ligase adenylyltransferase